MAVESQSRKSFLLPLCVMAQLSLSI